LKLATSTDDDSESQFPKVLINQDFTIPVNQILMSFTGGLAVRRAVAVIGGTFMPKYRLLASKGDP
jgi:hypothetical protein